MQCAVTGAQTSPRVGGATAALAGAIVRCEGFTRAGPPPPRHTATPPADAQSGGYGEPRINKTAYRTEYWIVAWVRVGLSAAAASSGGVSCSLGTNS